MVRAGLGDQGGRLKYNIDSDSVHGLARIRDTKQLIEDVLQFLGSHGGSVG